MLGAYMPGVGGAGFTMRICIKRRTVAAESLLRLDCFRLYYKSFFVCILSLLSF